MHPNNLETKYYMRRSCLLSHLSLAQTRKPRHSASATKEPKNAPAIHVQLMCGRICHDYPWRLTDAWAILSLMLRAFNPVLHGDLFSWCKSLTPSALRLCKDICLICLKFWKVLKWNSLKIVKQCEASSKCKREWSNANHRGEARHMWHTLWRLSPSFPSTIFAYDPEAAGRFIFLAKLGLLNPNYSYCRMPKWVHGGFSGAFLLWPNMVNDTNSASSNISWIRLQMPKALVRSIFPDAVS